MRTFNLRNDTRLQNLFAIIATLESKGLVCGVHEDGAGKFFARGKRSLLTDTEREGIDVCREGLREAWLLMQERCVRCGLDPAKRPNAEGRVLIGAVYNEDKGQMAYRWAKVSSLLVTPYFCDDCYDNPQAWCELMGEPKANARSAAEQGDADTEELPTRQAEEETRQDGFVFAD